MVLRSPQEGMDAAEGVTCIQDEEQNKQFFNASTKAGVKVTTHTYTHTPPQIAP